MASHSALIAATHTAELDFNPCLGGILEVTDQYKSPSGIGFPAFLQDVITWLSKSSGSSNPRLGSLSNSLTFTGKSSANEAPYPRPAACSRLHPPLDVPEPKTAM